MTCQVMLDKVLYDVDRAIDLYAVGVDEFSEPERRAAAFSFVINQSCARKSLSAWISCRDVIRRSLRETLREYSRLPTPKSVGE